MAVDYLAKFKKESKRAWAVWRWEQQKIFKPYWNYIYDCFNPKVKPKPEASK